MKTNMFRPQKNQQIQITKKYIDVKDEKLFPALHQAYIVKENVMNFKDILNTETTEIIKETPIAPGWVNIKKTDGKLVFKYGEMPEKKEVDLNEQMNRAINVMIERWNTYEEKYDEINGEGSFYELYRMPIESDYVTDDEDDDEDFDDEEFDCD